VNDGIGEGFLCATDQVLAWVDLQGGHLVVVEGVHALLAGFRVEHDHQPVNKVHNLPLAVFMLFI
jgi:hypothetical protein